MLAIYDEEPITTQGVQDTLAFIRHKEFSKRAIHLHKRTSFNGTLLNECRSTFKQSEKNRLAIIWTPETKFVVGSAEPTRNIKHFTETLRSPHRQCWKEAIYNHYKKNANVVLFFLPFLENILLPHTKICKPVLAPSIKIKDVMPNYCDLRMRLFQNGKEDSINKVNNSCSPTCLADSVRFSLATSS